MSRPLSQNAGEHFLKPLVRESGLSLGKLAQRIGCTQVYLSYVLSGRLVPAPKFEQKLRETVFEVCKNILTLSGDRRDEKKKDHIAKYINNDTE
jgi:transcriptional regulator with XRE-family HTH domain